MKNENIVFIENAGGMIITKSLLNEKTILKWLYREEPVNSQDNGWRAIGASDTQEYMNDPNNSAIVDFNTFANIEPAVLSVYNMPFGTELEFKNDTSGRYFVDLNNGNVIR